MAKIIFFLRSEKNFAIETKKLRPQSGKQANFFLHYPHPIKKNPITKSYCRALSFKKQSILSLLFIVENYGMSLR